MSDSLKTRRITKIWRADIYDGKATRIKVGMNLAFDEKGKRKDTIYFNSQDYYRTRKMALEVLECVLRNQIKDAEIILKKS